MESATSKVGTQPLSYNPFPIDVTYLVFKVLTDEQGISHLTLSLYSKENFSSFQL